MRVYFKVKPNKLSRWVAWCEKLKSADMIDYVLETLEYENVQRETCWLFQYEGQFYVVGQVISDDRKPADPTNQLNETHSAMKRECLERVESIPLMPENLWEVLYDFIR